MKIWNVAFAMLFVASQLAEAAPALKGKDVQYAPPKVGDKLEYETQMGGTISEHIEVVTEVEVKDGRLHITTARKLAWKTEVVIARVELAHKRNVSIAVGDAWPYRADPKLTFTVVKEQEEIEVPAGKFKAIRVESRANLTRPNSKTTAWYAPGVGLVKMSATTSGGVERIQVLKTFSPGK